MSFDKPTRNLLSKMVSAARDRLAEDISAQLQSTYGLYPDGSRLDVAQTPEDRHAAGELRALLEHFESAEPEGKSQKTNAYQRLIREIGFTLLNRLAALRLCEERGLVIECVRSGMNSAGFQLYDRLAGGALGNRYQTYQAFIEGMFDELAADLGVLFDRRTPQSAVFPSEPALNDVLVLLNDTELSSRKIWQQDETIGWIYQYYNDPAERKKMRDESQAPRNSRELAVRNQFFTPRYVVEFLTDNTLGRTWYEMRQGETRLTEQCRYLIQRRHPIFLAEGQDGPVPFDPATASPGDPDLPGKMWIRPNPELESVSDIFAYALSVGGYDYARKELNVECGELANDRREKYRETGKWDGSFEELRCCLFFEQRRFHHLGQGPEGEDVDAILALYKAVCEQWDREVDVVIFRAKKDPRWLRVLDPACGSGHFLLYAFDLLETIYAEAYDDPELGPDLRALYPERTAFIRQVPKLNLENNLHGIDIDPRTAQIAALALWLRAQRAWQSQKLGPAERPEVSRAHIVVAEPMPGDEGLLEEFIAGLPKDQHPEIIGPLVKTIFEKMKLAGEAGPLLKIEKELKETIDQARVAWSHVPQPEQLSFLPGQPKPKQLALDLNGETDENFWQQAEGLVLNAMENYARQAEDGKGVRRRLFSGDTAQGFALVDLCRKRYDVILMNPPFGDISSESFAYISRNYSGMIGDLAAVFGGRGDELSRKSGFIGILSPKAILLNKRLEPLRAKLLLRSLKYIVDLGQGVLDSAMIEVCCLILNAHGETNVLYTNVEDNNQQQAEATLLENIRSENQFNSWLIKDLKNFQQYPQRRIIFGPTSSIESLLKVNNPYEPEHGKAIAGLRTFKDERFLRLWWEVEEGKIGKNSEWAWFPKGGDYETYFYPVHVLVKWNKDGKELQAHNYVVNGQTAQARQGSSSYWQKGVTYIWRTPISFCPRLLPEGCVFSNIGPVILPRNGGEIAYQLAWLNSDLIRALVGIQSNSFAYTPGIIKQLPWIQPNHKTKSLVSELCLSIIQLKMDWYSKDETNPLFVSIFSKDVSSLEDYFQNEITRLEEYNNRILRMSGVVTEKICELYNIDVESVADQLANVENHKIQGPLDSIHESLSGSASRILAYCVGVVFGRWDIRIRFNTEKPYVSPDPFSALPTSSPGMLENLINNQLSKPKSSSSYPLTIPQDGILVDDLEWVNTNDLFERDIVLGIDKVFHFLWPEKYEYLASEICNSLGIKSIRDYFRKPSGFFADHLKRYSKSNRQAPIYWPLSTPTGSYTLWVYYHRLSGETLYTAVNRFVSPKIEQVERYLHKLESDLAEVFDRSGGELRDKVDATRAFLTELNEFRTELLRVANLPYQPDLNDGVIINAAPLYKLFRLGKWSKDCQAVWEKLKDGEYDWAHMAYVLWPGRVKEKCKTDKSLAIAHGLEALYQGEETGKKAKRKKNVEEVQEGLEF